MISILPAIDVLVSPVDIVSGGSVGVSQRCSGRRDDVDDEKQIMIPVMVR